MEKILTVGLCLCVMSSVVSADTFGTGDNQFTIDFVPISGASNPTSGIRTGSPYTNFIFSGVAYDYQMGTYEITNDQWTKFKAAYGAVTGSEWSQYDAEPYFTGSSVPTNNVSWHEAAQFVNWLNTSTGHPAAYKFTGNIHTSNYTLRAGKYSGDDTDGVNLYRNKNAKYFLPTENEWVKAAYWNGTNLQTYATKAGESLYQGNGSNGGWSYWNSQKYHETGYGCVTNPGAPWAVGSGSQELNGTYDMMGNVCEWLEGPLNNSSYFYNVRRGLRGGTFASPTGGISSSERYEGTPEENIDRGFRVVSVPEPFSLALLGLGGLALRYRKR